MALISANPNSSQAELASLAGITGPSLVCILDELEQRELVVRKRSETDRRRNILVLSLKGEQLTLELFAHVNTIESKIRDELGDRGIKQLCDLLDKAITAQSADQN